MTPFTPAQVRELLREVGYPGFSRDIVSAGFVRDVVTDGRGVVVHFAPNSKNEDKVRQMERGIRDVLSRADAGEVHIRTSTPFEDGMALRKPQDDAAPRRPIEADGDSDATIDAAFTGSGLMNPLQAELREDGIVAEPDMLRADLTRTAHDPAAGFAQEPPEPFEGPVAPGTTYEGVLPVFQWDIDPHDPAADSAETSVKIDDWEIRVWWQIHSDGELIYASLQAMRDDWADHIGAARQHPVGRSAAVNLVFDSSRQAVLAIYGTVRDFRPFVEAFRIAYFSLSGQKALAGEENAS
ncbi:MAG: DUF59 domain-containing protein [Bauldia sp.]|nr:DUF59 domain-containing protein [Bauldia sp.]